MGALAAVHVGAGIVLPSAGFSPPDALKSIEKEKSEDQDIVHDKHICHLIHFVQNSTIFCKF